jgi:EAL domain-containing protein (putative c-di-GMP-specific phosphodiesterase class I)
LLKFPFDKIKIDQSFIRDVGKRCDADAIVRAVVGLGHSLGMQICAEGVETAEQLSFLKSENCDEVQGYLVGEPMSVVHFERSFAAPPMRHRALNDDRRKIVTLESTDYVAIR